MLDKFKEEQDSLKKRNPYQLLKYINCLAKFYHQMKSDISYGNVEGFINQLINITEKYNK